MPDEVGSVQAYREWAAQREGLAVFARPAWLDVVAPGQWGAELVTDAKGRCRRAWAYVPRERFGLRWATLPPATPYLGPYWPSGHVRPGEGPPPGLGYAAFTTDDPGAAWRYGRSCRAMATQVVDLRDRAPYDSDLRRRLRRGATGLRVEPVTTAAAFADLSALLEARPEAAPRHWSALYAEAYERGLASAWRVFDGEGRIQAMAVVPGDGTIGYLTVQLRAAGAPPATTTVLIDRILSDLADAGVSRLDMESGYLPGVRSFHARFGARPQWYGQVRLYRGVAWRALGKIRSVTNRKRL